MEKHAIYEDAGDERREVGECCDSGCFREDTVRYVGEQANKGAKYEEWSNCENSEISSTLGMMFSVNEVSEMGGYSECACDGRGDERGWDPGV